jgi:subtilisin family serine protease
MRKYVTTIILIMTLCLPAFSQIAVEIKLKPQENKSYTINKDVDLRAISDKHGAVLKQSYPNAKNPELLLYYDLIIKDSKGSKEDVIKDYIKTGKFENDVREFEKIYPTSCNNPVQVNDARRLQTGNSYPLNMIEAPCAWNITKGSGSISIGIVDTEFLTTHEDLKNKFTSVEGPATPTLIPHGSLTASVAAAETNNSLGIASVGYNSRIAAYTIDYESPNSNPFDIRDAIWSLYQKGIRIINVSWSGTNLTQLAAKEITENGTTLVLSGGNETTSTSHSSIANTPGVIVVSSVDINNMHGPTYNARNQWIDICAPGKDILAAGSNNTGYYVESGTSLAAPFVSGTIALMLSINNSLTPTKIEEIIKSTADPVADGNNYIGLLGAGRLNAYKAVQAVQAIGCSTLNLHNQTITANTNISNCKVSINNVKVQNNAKVLILANETSFSGTFEVLSGSFTVK